MGDLVGAWRLRSAYVVAHRTGNRLDILGAEPFGYVVFEPSGRMIALLTSGVGARGAAATDVEALHKSMIAYTGMWSIHGETLVTKVDGAWDPSWIGTEQVRHLAFGEGTLSVRSTPVSHPSFPGEEVIVHVEWEKEVVSAPDRRSG